VNDGLLRHNDADQLNGRLQLTARQLLARVGRLACVLIVCCWARTAAAQNLMNPGFETGALGAWQVYISGTGSVTVGTGAHSGRYGITETANNNTEVTFQDVTGLTPGQTYLVSVWVASSSATSGTVALDIHDTQGNGWVGITITPGTSWQQISQAYTVTGNGAMRIHLYENPGPETTYWDDVTLIPVLPLNGGFETEQECV